MIMNKLLLFSVFSILTLNVMAQEKIVQTAAQVDLPLPEAPPIK